VPGTDSGRPHKRAWCSSEIEIEGGRRNRGLFQSSIVCLAEFIVREWVGHPLERVRWREGSVVRRGHLRSGLGEEEEGRFWWSGVRRDNCLNRVHIFFVEVDAVNSRKAESLAVLASC